MQIFNFIFLYGPLSIREVAADAIDYPRLQNCELSALMHMLLRLSDGQRYSHFWQAIAAHIREQAASRGINWPGMQVIMIKGKENEEPYPA